MSSGFFRLFLALIVVFHHSLGFFGFGAVAVYLFFVLSGYWTSRMWDQKYSKLKFSYAAFVLSRWLRIVPVLLFCVLSYSLASLGAPEILPGGVDLLLSPQWWTRTALLVGITTQPLILAPAWSLAVEMQFYLLLPLAIGIWSAFRLGNRGWTVVFLCIGLFHLFVGYSSMSGNVLLFLTFFWFGIRHWKQSCASHAGTLKWGLIGFTTLVIISISIPSYRIFLTNYPEGRTEQIATIQNLFSYIAAILLVPVALNSVGRSGGSLDRWLGNLSYPVYLFHMIPIKIYYAYRDQIEIPGIVLLAVTWTACLLGSILILQYVDRPCEHLRGNLLRRFSKRLPRQQEPGTSRI